MAMDFSQYSAAVKQFGKAAADQAVKELKQEGDLAAAVQQQSAPAPAAQGTTPQETGTVVDFSLGGGDSATPQQVMGIATPRQRIEAQGISSDIANATSTLPATFAAGVERGVGSLQTSLGYAPETQNLQPEYNADLGGYVEVDQNYSPFRSNPDLMKRGLANMSEADMVKAQIEKEKPVLGILGKAVREGGFQIGNMAPTLPLAAIPGIGPDLALGAMSMASGADAIKKGKEIGLTDTEISEYRGKTELPEYLGEKANFGTFMATLSGKNPFIKQILKLAGTEFLSEAGTSHFQFAADKAYEKPGLTKEAREAIYNGIVSGKALADDPKLLTEYVAMQKDTAIAVAGMTGLTGIGGKAHRAATGILSSASQVANNPAAGGLDPGVQSLPPVNPARSGLQDKLATIMGGETDETAAARLTEIQAKKDKASAKIEDAVIVDQAESAAPTVKESLTVQPEVLTETVNETIYPVTEATPATAPVSSAVPDSSEAKPASEKASAELETQAASIETFIEQIGDTTDPALLDTIGKAKENLAAIRSQQTVPTTEPASAPAEPKATAAAPAPAVEAGSQAPSLDTAPTADMYSGLGNMQTQGQAAQGKGDFVPVPGEDGKGKFRQIKKKTAEAPAAPVLPKMQQGKIKALVTRLGSMEAVTAKYGARLDDSSDLTAQHAKMVAAELYPQGAASVATDILPEVQDQGPVQVDGEQVAVPSVQNGVEGSGSDNIKPGGNVAPPDIKALVDGKTPAEVQKTISMVQGLNPDRANQIEAYYQSIQGGDVNAVSSVQQKGSEGQTKVPDVRSEAVKKHEGKTGKAFTAKGTEIDFKYAVVEADDLNTSHTADGVVNPDYPQEIQPRNREKVSSQLQIKQISQALRAPQLGESAKVSSGSPFVGPDGVVESGNGRSLAIRLAYDTDKAGEYRAWLHTVAPQYGLKEADIAKMKKPVFVRVRQTEVDRAEFAREANQGGMASMSPAELAKADAARLTADNITSLNVGEDGNLLGAGNRAFVSSFLKNLGSSESAGLTDAQGNPTRQLADRMQAAIFAKAYGDQRLVSMMSEEADVDIKNIINALNAAAPTFARIDNKDIAKNLTDAIGIIREAKSRGLSFNDFIDQQDMFAPERDADSETIARQIDGMKRSGKKMAEAFRALADASDKNEKFSEQDNLLGEKPKTKSEIIAAAFKTEVPKVEQLGLLDKPSPAPKAKGSDNKVFTEDAYLKAKAILKAKLDNQLNSGFDPELMQAGISVAGYHLEAGARKFAAFAKAMIEDLGGNIKPYLKSFYNGVRDLPGIDFTGEMDDYGTVSGHDLDHADTTAKESTTQVEIKSERVPPKGSTEESFRERFKDKPWIFAPGVFEEETGEFTKSEGLTPEGQAVEDALFKRLSGDPEKMMQEYLDIAHPIDGKPGNRTMLEIMETQPVIINPDEGRALSREYDLNPAKYAHATHEPVSALAKMVGAQALTVPDPRGINRVLILGGGGGSGKGSAMKATPELAETEHKSQIIFGGTMAKKKNFVKIFIDAVKNDKKVFAAHVHRDMDGAVSGIVGRKWDNAIILDGEVVPGRDVPIHAAAEAHYLSGEVFIEMAEEYGGDSRIEFAALDNSDGPTHEVSIDELKGLVQAKLAGLSYLDFKSLVADLYSKYETNTDFNPYVKGGKYYGRTETRNGRIESTPGGKSTITGGSSGSQSGLQEDNSGALRELQPEHSGENTDNVSPETWWDNQLTKSGREKILDGIGSRVKPGIKWRYVSKEEKSVILAERGGELDAIAAEGVTNVSNPSNESTGTGSESTAAVTPGDNAPTVDDGSPGDVAGIKPDAVQEPVQSGSDNTAVDGPVGPDATGDGPGSTTTVPAPRPARNYADVPSPSHTVGSARNFTITSLDFTGQGDKTKYKGNVAAIRLIKQLDSELRPATPEEQNTLSYYVGWGGLANAFDAKKKEWAKEHLELKELLTTDEYDAARASTRNAHYTAADVVNGMWQGIQRLGFDRGAVLEPSVGTGNFFGLMPREVRSMSNLTGVELDPITSKIAGYLYPQAKIHNTGFQNIQITPGSYDLAIGNPPFAADGVFDPSSKLLSSFNLHGYFFAKSIESLRPGGVLAMVVSDSLMDNKQAAKGIKQRQWMGDRTRLLGAIRLPNNAFAKNAGTEVTTDIVFLQKLSPGETGNTAEWLNVGTVKDKATGGDITINQYFVDHPEMMLGEMGLAGSMYRAGSQSLVSREGDNLAELLQGAIDNLPQGVMTAKSSDDLVTASRKGAPQKTGSVRLYNFFEEDGKLYQRIPDINGEANAIDVELKGKTAERMKSLIAIRDTLRKQLQIEAETDASADELQANRDQLNKLYDAFVKTNGYISNDTNKRLFWEDADSPLVRSLEREYDKGVSKEQAKSKGIVERKPSAKKADVFTKRVISPAAIVTTVTSATDALAASMNEKGRVDFNYMTGIYGDKSQADIIKELGDTVYEDPSAGWQTASQYLSGNVKTKLAEAIIAAKETPRYARNVEALDAVQPADIPASDIYVAPHSFWVPEAVFHQFAADIFKGDMKGGYSKATGKWDVRFTSSDAVANNSTYGTRRMSGTTIMATLMANKQIVVKDAGATKDDPPVINKDETAAAQAKADEMVDMFQDWIWKDQERRTKAVRFYNDTMNTNVKTSYDGSHLTLPGKVSTFDYRPHQLNVIYRMLQTGVVLLDHVVGSGKTAIMTAATMEMKRLGLAKKPMIAVPNHLVEQWAASFAKLYPNAKVLAATKKDFAKDKRREMFAKIATGDWDVVIVAHSSFKFIPVPRETEIEILKEQEREFIAAIQEAKAEEGKALSVKKLEAARDKIKDKLSKLADMPKDDLINFKEMGVDALFVDEAHEFKNLYYTTTMQNVSGLGSPSGSGRAFDMFVKTQYLMRRNGGKGVYFATGTPVSNSLAEVYHMQRFLQYDELKARGIANFDAWASAFGRVTSDWEQDAGGRFKQKTRFRSLVNLPELKKVWGTVVDTVTNKQVADDAIAQNKPFWLPKMDGGKPKNVVVDRSPQQAMYIGEPKEMTDSNGDTVYDSQTGMPVVSYDPGTIVYRMGNWQAEQKAGNTREMPLVITGEARKAGLDFRLIDEDAPDFAGSKVNTAVNEIVAIHKDNDYRKGTQLVFCDLSTPKAHKGKALEKLAETMPTYFVKANGTITHVPGKPVKLKSLPEEEFFYTSKGSGAKRTVTIYERQSGLEVGQGNDVNSAKNQADNKVERQGAEALTKRLRELAIPSDQIDEYIANWEEQQAETEDTEEEEESPASAVSFDDVLADSGKSNFSVYDDMRDKLIAKGIPADQIAFIHDYNTDAQKHDLFDKVNNGVIRILFGSTPKMGAGTNVQKRLVGLHHMDAPWKPSDLAQREGRIARQGNIFWNEKSEFHDPDFIVKIRRYATKQTYDSRMWEINEIKARSIEDFRTGGDDVREVEDVSSESANAAEIKASSAGNPLMLEDLKLKKEVQRLSGIEKSWRRGRFDLEDLVKQVDRKDTWAHKQLVEYKALVPTIAAKNPEELGLKIGKIGYDGDTDMTPEGKASISNKIGNAIKSAYVEAQAAEDVAVIGSYRGTTIKVNGKYSNTMKLIVFSSNGSVINETSYGAEDKFTLSGFIRRLDNILDSVPTSIQKFEDTVAESEKRADNARAELKQPFKYEQQLAEAKAQHAKVISALRSGKKSLSEVGDVAGNPYTELAGMKTEYADKEFTATPLDEGLVLDSLGLQQIYERLSGAKIVKDAMADLKKLGAHVYASGSTAWKPWFQGMKSALGKLFSRFRGPLEHVYKFTVNKVTEKRGSLGDMFKGKQGPVISIASTNPEIEKRWKAAKGLGDNSPTWRERLADLKDQIMSETQHFPDIDMSNRAGKRTADILRRFEAAGAAAKAKAVSHLQTLTNGFNEDQMEAFTRAVILGDLMNEASKGHELPFGYTPATLIADHLAVTAIINQSPEIQAALQRRKDVNKEMVLQLVENDLLPVESVLKESARDHYRSTGKYDESDINTDYYRHQVLAHAAAKQWAGLSTAGDLRNKKRGWMKERHGSTSDINTNFLEAEFEWFSQSMKELATKKALDEVLQVNDIAQQLKTEAKATDVEDWKDLIPEDHIAWQPVKGSVFYRGQTLTEEAVTKFIEQNPAFADVAAQFRDVMIMGAKKREAVIPMGLAETLDNLRINREDALLDTINKKLIGAWKINTLLNPHRIIKYNLNNMSGDMDAAIAADPAILKYMWTAFKNALARKKGAELTGADKDMLDRGVLDAGISINEIPDINKLPGFKHLSETARSTKLWDSLKTGHLAAVLPHNLVAKYFDFVSGWTQVREGLLREAAYLRALELLNQGKTIYWASDAMELNSIPNNKDKAAKLSRELLGDYGNLSAHSEKIRTSFVPFWSWMEINTPRYFRIFKNAALQGEGGSNSARMAGVAGSKVAGAALGLAEKALLVQLMFALISLYNRWVWPDEEEALGENGRKQLHIIIGKTSEGKTMTVRFQGAFSDVLGWVGLEDYPSMIRRYAEGKMDNMDVVRKMLLAGPNKLFNASMPFFKLPAELIAGKSFYPDITKPVPIRDRKEHIARFFTFDAEYRAIAGKPSKGYADGFKSSLVYESDPGEQAYNSIRSQAFKFMEKNGKEFSGGEPSKRANALYYYRQAKRYDDKVAEAKYLQQYLDEGGKRSKISESINRAAPLASLPTNLRYKFRGSLSEADKVTLDRANTWYREVYKK